MNRQLAPILRGQPSGRARLCLSLRRVCPFPCPYLAVSGPKIRVLVPQCPIPCLLTYVGRHGQVATGLLLIVSSPSRQDGNDIFLSYRMGRAVAATARRSAWKGSGSQGPATMTRYYYNEWPTKCTRSTAACTYPGYPTQLPAHRSDVS